MAAHTVDDVVAADVQTTDAIKALSEKHAAEMAPLANKQKILRAWLQGYLIEHGLDSAKTQHGTPYLSTVLSATIDKESGDGWEKLIDFVMRRVLLRASEILETHGGDDEAALEEAIRAAAATPELNLINRSVNKTAIKELMENQEGFDPLAIGVKTAQIVNLNVRRA